MLRRLIFNFRKCMFVFNACGLLFISGHAQEKTHDTKVASLKVEIAKSTDTKKLKYLDSLTSLVEHQSSYGYETLAKETIDLAIKLDSINLAAKHTGMLILFLTNRKERPEDGLEIFQEFSKNLSKVSDKKILIELLLRGASSYFYSGQAQESLKWYDRAKELAIATKDSTRYGKAMSYKAFALSEMGQFTSASQEFQKSLSVFNIQRNTTDILTTKIGLSILYAKNGFYKESLEELDYISDTAHKTENYPVYIMSLIIIGSNHYLSGDYIKAIGPLKESITLAEAYPKYSSSITTSYKTLANSYSKMDSIELARKAVNKIRESMDSGKLVEMNFMDAQMHLFFAEKKYGAADSLGRNILELQTNSTDYEDILSTLEVLFLANREMGNVSKDFEYFRKHTHIKDSVNNIRKLNSFSYYQALYEKEKRDILIGSQSTEILLLDAKNSIQFQWTLLITTSLLSLGIYFYFFRKRNKEKIEFEKTKKELALQKMKAVELNNDLLNKDINYKKKDLTNFAIEIRQNQQWARILLEKFENIKNWKYQEKEIKDLGNEIRAKLIVDIEPSELQERIEQVGSEFYDKLNEKVSNLTKTELKLCGLIRLKLTPKEIANLQNITHSSVITSRYRLRKKLFVNSDDTLDTFIHNL